ncbi:5-oxoprolinase subunit PxpB [Gemmobacter sp.]|uniref:5-oxoprolinase subunit PxpB n=1 Tax=Gemmobacter sp. TaxID=1898957 RepID=UPI002AFF0677|nr:5-oxoprolinase subunit PxpB [Gemmobacter sp.]
MTAPRILPCGDAALSVDFGNVIDLGVNAQVMALDRALAADPVPGVVETVPTYRALMVQFDPLATEYDALCRHLLALAARTTAGTATARRWRVPVAYGGDHGEDLASIAAYAGLSPAAFVEAHAAPVYTLMMIGFMPGFSYLGGLYPRLARPRRDTPRLRVPASSVSIGGAQTAIGSVEGPSGWHLIGRTPALPFVLGRDPVFLFGAGDEIVFAPISGAEWRQLSDKAARGAPVAERIA